MTSYCDFIPALDHGGPEKLEYPGYPDEWLERSVFERFEHQAFLHPHKIAIRDREGQSTYTELLAECRNLGHQIVMKVPHGSPVVLALPVDRHYPAAMLAALAAGRPYVPLDLSQPPDRLRQIVAHSGSKHVLTDNDHRILIEECLPDGVELLLPQEDLSNKLWAKWRSTATSDDIAYVIYTSGSSGAPKGVYQNQRGLTHDILQYARSAHLRPDDVLTCLYSPSVNGALRDIYGALLNGATLLLFDLKRDGLGYVAQEIRRWRATILHTMPPVMRGFLRSLKSPDNLSSVRLVYLAGDKLFASDLQVIRTHLAVDAVVYFGIGSTECATLYRHWFLPRDFSPTGALVPAGLPIPDRQVELLDAEGHPVPPGEIGQIFVSSPYVARGYWKDETRTLSQFTLLPERPGWSRFATGDLGRIQPDGLLIFEGRADRQIKIRGYRVEPAETECALRSLPGVQDAAVVAVQVQDLQRLVAFVVLDENDVLSGLLQKIRNILPAHLCPAEIFPIPSLPLLSNFKVDANALVALAQEKLIQEREVIPALDAIENCWLETLQISRINPERSFVDEGGDSLKALELHVALEKALGRYLPLDGFRMDMTAADLSLWLQALPQDTPVERNQRPSHLFIVSPDEGITSNTLILRNTMACDMKVTVLDIPKSHKNAPYTKTIEELAATLLPAVLDKLHPDHKLVFLGLCNSGRIAHEIATRLQAQGVNINLLVIVDIPRSFDWTQRSRGSFVITLKRWMHLKLALYLPMQLLLHWRETYRPGARLSWWHRKMRKWNETWLSHKHIHGWRPQMLYSPSLLLLSADLLQQNPKVPRDLGWSTICSSLTVLPMGLSHIDYSKRPHSAALRAVILDILDQTPA